MASDCRQSPRREPWALSTVCEGGAVSPPLLIKNNSDMFSVLQFHLSKNTI